jgi:hypothetical protein
MGTYWTKCGKQFTKATDAATTGYRLPDTKDETDPQCLACLFRKSIQKGWPSVHDHWECRAGSQEPCEITEYRGSVEDTRSLYVISLYPVLLEQIREWCVQHPDLEAQYNQDLPDCREQLSVRCTQNVKGKQAKKELVQEFKLEKAEDIKAQRVVSFAGMKFPVENQAKEPVKFCRDCQHRTKSDKGAEHPLGWMCFKAEHRGGLDWYLDDSAEACGNFEEKEPQAPTWKPRCPYLASLGQKHVDCSINSRFIGTERFNTAQELKEWLEDVCEGNFEKCSNYEIGYAREKEYPDRGCINCCNNTWHTGLKPGEDGQKLCYCQIKKQPMPHHEKCEWYNKIYRETEVEKVKEELIADQGELTVRDWDEETAVAAFDYGAVDADTATYLQDKARTITEIRVKSVIAIGRELEETFAKFAKLPYGNRTQLFDQWCESIGFSPRSARNYIQGYEYVVKNFHNIDSAPEIQPSLLFAISKPSAPAELREAVHQGDITTYKEYQEAMERIKQVEAERDKMLADNRAMYLDLEAADQRIQHWEKKANRSQQEIEAFRNDVARFKDKISDKDNEIKYLQDKLEQEKKNAQVDKPNPAKELELKMLRDQIEALEAERQELQERLEEKPIDVGEVIKEVIKEKEVIPEDLKLATWTLVDDLLTNLIDLKNIQWTVFIDHLSTDDCLEYSKVIDHQIIPRLSAMAARMRCRLS